MAEKYSIGVLLSEIGLTIKLHSLSHKAWIGYPYTATGTCSALRHIVYMSGQAILYLKQQYSPDDKGL